MAAQTLTQEQVVQLVKQLPIRTKQQVLKALTDERDQWWQKAALDGEQAMRQLAADRDLDWDTLSESEREAFVDAVLHES
jgi:hypothetical protein